MKDNRKVERCILGMTKQKQGLGGKIGVRSSRFRWKVCGGEK